MGLDHILGHPIFRVEQFEQRPLLCGGPLAHQGPVAGAQAFEGPDDADLGVEAAAAVVRLVVRPAEKRPAVERPAGAAPLQHQAGNQRAKLFLPR